MNPGQTGQGHPLNLHLEINHDNFILKNPPSS
jgi:hypothetical protein